MLDDGYTIVLAPNASLMTGPGTNTIVLGGGVEGATVIDPADNDLHYLEKLVSAGVLRGDIRRILVTHGHSDHFGGAEELGRRLGITTYAYSCEGVPVAGEALPDGMIIPAGRDRLRAIYTPGHRFDHLCFYLEQQRVLFAGDLLAGTGTVVISPPEGNMGAYLQSLRQLQALDIEEIVPAHGPVIKDAQAKLAEYIDHRLQREQQILQELKPRPHAVAINVIVQKIYVGVDPRLHVPAAKSVEAHLLKLELEGIATRTDDDCWCLN